MRTEKLLFNIILLHYAVFKKEPVFYFIVFQLYRNKYLKKYFLWGYLVAYNIALKKGANHGPNNYKDIKPKMSSLLVFIRIYRLEIQSIMLVFSTLLVN